MGILRDLREAGLRVVLALTGVTGKDADKVIDYKFNGRINGMTNSEAVAKIYREHDEYCVARYGMTSAEMMERYKETHSSN